ncbi:efflux RND transporter periplasmic adaptor subunit [Xanthovirga aplysinae]|uniref:efflux RND transporter periplasmic adaptor subunit n=1 Tax=Xanthovirga aplysinae TaxID=2529853 RepID=UPI0012BD5F58|nr:efflux RND transporter periplasmic adaptor subunit [Xanthovirga aplysinae]MTI33027.1 efflux RND transporter periplasmic adaptor subunit [Xanthovirga aplysinae]
MRYIFIIFFAFLAASCQSPEDHGHPHDEEGGHNHAGEGTPTEDVTAWTNKTELFVEFPALVVNKTSRFATHLTILDGHQALTEGEITVSLIKDGKGIRQTVEKASSPGIFRPSLKPKTAGVHQLVFDIKAPSYQDRIVIKKVQVFATTEEARKKLGGEDEKAGAISFLKEQAWKMEFQTAPVIQGEIYDVIHTSGVWKDTPSANRSLAANASGLAHFTIENLTEGTKVKKNQLLMTISSKGLATNNLQAEIAKARANYEKAEAEYNRKQKLYASKIVPKSEFEEVENNYKLSKLAYETLKAGYVAGGKQVRAPFDGFIKSIHVNNGIYVEQGAPLVSIGRQGSVLLEAHASSTYGTALKTIHNIWYQPKNGQWSNLKKSGGSVLSVGKEVERNKPLIPVYADVNEIVDMPEGSFTEVQIAVGNPRKSILIPEAALLEDYGNYAVIVQLSGESFERRNVKTGRRNGAHIEITDGLKAGEVVVTKGVYQVKMASMSGQTPAHGHEH